MCLCSVAIAADVAARNRSVLVAAVHTVWLHNPAWAVASAAVAVRAPAMLCGTHVATCMETTCRCFHDLLPASQDCSEGVTWHSSCL